MARPDGTGSREPSPAVSALPGFDPSRIMREFYLSRYYEPNAERAADNVQAAIEFTIDRYYAGLEHLSPAETIGRLASRMVNLAPLAGLHVGIKIAPRDSDGSPEGEDRNGLRAEHESAAIAQGGPDD